MPERILEAIDDIVGAKGGVIRLTWKSSRLRMQRVELFGGDSQNFSDLETFRETEEFPYDANEAGQGERARILAIYLLLLGDSR